MAARGYTSDAIKHTLTTTSPYLAHSREDDVQDSIDRLVDEVMQLPDVVTSQQFIFCQDQHEG
jgi:hypothetical protein